ncbi:hypothetical protein SteCoe_30932 [Stentor coeruleus]|uniref:Uncharacterized protein n=1 Tax=Stentor coeruleus TaxID=5963 RepID=A0A1R2B2W2_9CILI|nr:hypothetical protein SteCoe_30932 [Stentor coeruleus]
MPLGSCSDCLQTFKIFSHLIVPPLWSLTSLVIGIYLKSNDICGGNLQNYVFVCCFLIALWFLILKLGKLKYENQKLPNSYLITMGIILVIHAFTSVLMTIKILDPSLDKCYESTSDSSQTTAFDLNAVNLGSIIGKKKEMNYSKVKNFIYLNDIISFGLLIYGIYKFTVSKLRHEEGQSQGYEQIRDS